MQTSNAKPLEMLLLPKNFAKQTLTLSFVFYKYYLIINQLDLKGSSHKLQVKTAELVISFIYI